MLEDIRRTIRAFQDFFRDDPRYGYTGTGGYFSHVDYATLRPDVDSLGQNKLRKNWNSIGDHIPAYLVNLIIALDPSPRGLPIDFAWSNTKDFWQQEQAILAYLIVYGFSRDANHLQLAREMMAFWNLYFLDHDNRGVFFRVTADGIPVIQGNYSQKAGHAVA